MYGVNIMIVVIVFVMLFYMYGNDGDHFICSLVRPNRRSRCPKRLMAARYSSSE